MSFQWQNSRGYFTLFEVAEMLQELVSVGFEQYFWIKAEVVKMQTYGQSGHAYLTLSDKENGQVKTEFRANIWSSDFRRIQQKFRLETGEDFRQGQTVLLLGRPGFHPQYGLSINIRDIDTSFSLGEMARQRKETLAWLEKTGLLHRNQELELSAIPGRLAVISDASSDGYSDFVTKLREEGGNYRISLALFPAHLQGDAAVEGISRRLSEISAQAFRFDAVCIIRGGGGEVGMTCYDHQTMAEAVARCPLPVLTGIGHSTNLTVVEQIAWKNLITPTDLAFFILNRFHEQSRQLDELLTGVLQAHEILKMEKSRILELSKRAAQLTRMLLKANELKLGKVQHDVILRSSGKTQQGFQQLTQIKRDVERLTFTRIKERNTELSELQILLNNHYNEGLFRRIQQLSLAETKVRLLDPSQVLKRGYSIATFRGKALKSAEGLQSGDPIEVRLHRSLLHVKLDTFENHDSEEEQGRTEVQ